MRIIGGQFKRSVIAVPALAGLTSLRPTPSRVRETLFNWLGQDLTGLRCLDAFAGSGALGFEAASRGAARVDLVEQNATLCTHLRATQARLKANTVYVHQQDAISYLTQLASREPNSLDILFLDPPFDIPDLYSAALAQALKLLASTGLLYLEHAATIEDPVPNTLGLRCVKNGAAGAVLFGLWQVT